MTVGRQPVARGPAPFRRFLTLLCLLIGGAVAGPMLARAVARGSSVAEFISFLVLPMSLLVGVTLWLGLATMAALFTTRLRRASRPADAPEARRGAFMFVPVSVALSGAVGLLVALLPGGKSFVVSFLAYLMLGMVYGTIAWQLAARGHLPTVENMNE